MNARTVRWALTALFSSWVTGWCIDRTIYEWQRAKQDKVWKEAMTAPCEPCESSATPPATEPSGDEA